MLRPSISTKSKKITRAAFSGGGAKGVTLGGAYQAMATAEMLSGLEYVSGASAGALSAACIAAGIEPTDFRQLLLTTNLKSLTGASVWERKPGVVPGFTGDGKPLLELLRRTIRRSIDKALNKLSVQYINDKDKRELAIALRKKIADADAVTFLHLAELNAAFPEKFKKLTIFAVRFPEGTPQVLNDIETPGVEVALAARASSALPIFFEPVDIIINGATHSHNDGGQYDNLPTEYYDVTENGEYTNAKPEETLVFAFGEGLDNSKSPVHQAVHGEAPDKDMKTLRILDLAVDDKIIEILNNKKIKISKINAQLLDNILKILLNLINEQDSQQRIPKTQAKKIFKHIKNALNNEDFWIGFKLRANGHITRQFKDYIFQKITPALYQPSFISKIARNKLVQVVGGFKGDYKNTGQKEVGYQRLRDFYRDRTIELRSGKIKTAHFDKATKHARVMDSLGYLDTMFYVTTQHAHTAEFDPKHFYKNLLANFEIIYKATLAGANTDLQKDELLSKINLMKLTANSLQDDLAIYRVIKDYVEKNLDTPTAFAMSRTVEYQNNLIDYQQLCNEIYQESFKRSGLFAKSNVAGFSIFSNSTLKSYLTENDVRMDDTVDKNTRRGKIYAHLKQIDPRLFPVNEVVSAMPPSPVAHL